MVGKKKDVSVGKLLVWLSFIEASCALLFSPLIFGIRGIVFGILAYLAGEKKRGVWGIVSNVVGAGVGMGLASYLARLGATY